MIEGEEKKGKKDAESVKEILGVVSSEIPGLIKSLLASVFSEEAGKNMGKAAAAYYRELKSGGLPEEVAVKMTEDYMRTFTNIGAMLRGSGGGRHAEGAGSSVGDEIQRRIRENVEKRRKGSSEEEE